MTGGMVKDRRPQRHDLSQDLSRRSLAVGNAAGFLSVHMAALGFVPH